MSLTITLQSETASRVARDAKAAGVSPDQIVNARIHETELLWKIKRVVFEVEIQELRMLNRLQKSNKLTQEDRLRLRSLLEILELKTAERMIDLGKLAELRNMPVRQLMNELCIEPIHLD